MHALISLPSSLFTPPTAHTPHHTHTQVLGTILINGYATAGNIERAVALFEELRNDPDPQRKPNRITYNSMIKVVGSNTRTLAHTYTRTHDTHNHNTHNPQCTHSYRHTPRYLQVGAM